MRHAVAAIIVATVATVAASAPLPAGEAGEVTTSTMRSSSVVTASRPAPTPPPRRPVTPVGAADPQPGARPAHTTAPCGAHGEPSDEWPLVNKDLSNSRSQSDENTIGVGQLADLSPAWSFDAGDLDEPGAGGLRTTPIVAGGCVFLAMGQGYLGERGDIVALDADTGDRVWHTRLDGSVLGLAAANGLIYATPSRGTRGDVEFPVVTEDYTPEGSYAVALDAGTGAVRWQSERLDDGNANNGTFINATPVPFQVGGRQLLFVALAGGGGDGARVPMYFLDARTGHTVARSYSLTDEEYEAGFGGTGIWSTAAFDPQTNHLYVGTADSDGHTRQHRFNNAILKIDADPRRSTFATVVDAYSGTTEHADLDDYVGYPNNPLCQSGGEGLDVNPPTMFDTSAAPQCLELDFDFGASPNLYRDQDGRLQVGALQKSGWFHSVDSTTMEADWRFPVGPGGAIMDSATAAVHDGAIFVGATPNLLFRLAQTSGQVGWVSATDAELFAYQPVTFANGVVYAINDSGFLVAVDAESGLVLLRRSVAVDGDLAHCLGVGAGVAIARSTLYVPCDAGGPHDLAGLPGPSGGLVAYRLD